ncbi:MAG: hypothetical protein E3J90_08435 [Promethearchaeota archaeon]|nr:MAG: hypothetical protein E3J90_08435 [Candidatus Lokiarchaeota archaeon]
MLENQIEEIIERLLDEFNRYRINLDIILAIRFLIKSNNLNINICPPERKVNIAKKSINKPPDIILYDSDHNFVINEVKSSISPSKGFLEQILDYLNIESILDDDGNPITHNDYSLNLIINIESYKDTRDYLLAAIDINQKNKFSITTFTRSESIPKRGTIYYLFELRDNRTILTEYNNLLNSLTKVFSIDKLLEGEQLYFTSDPPVQYTITLMWSLIIPSIIQNKKEQEFSFDEVQGIIREYYCRWDHDIVFFRKKWLRKAFSKLSKIKWIRQTSYNNYKVIKTLNLQKNVTEIISEKLARLEIEENGLEEETKSKPTQINLTKFLGD